MGLYTYDAITLHYAYRPIDIVQEKLSRYSTYNYFWMTLPEHWRNNLLPQPFKITCYSLCCEQELHSQTQVVVYSSFCCYILAFRQEKATSPKAAERGAGETKCPRASRSKGPHVTQCFKVWGLHEVNQQ